MAFYVYVLHSGTLDRYYVGFSKFGDKRRRQHCKGQTYWTSRANDWVEVWRKEEQTMQAAALLEKKIKHRGAKRFLLAEVGHASGESG